MIFDVDIATYNLLACFFILLFWIWGLHIADKVYYAKHEEHIWEVVGFAKK